MPTDARVPSVDDIVGGEPSEDEAKFVQPSPLLCGSLDGRSIGIFEDHL